MMRLSRLAAPLLTAAPLLSGCAAGQAAADSAADEGCPESGPQLPVTPTGEAAGKRFPTIGPVDCGEEAIEVNGYPSSSNPRPRSTSAPPATWRSPPGGEARPRR